MVVPFFFLVGILDYIGRRDGQKGKRQSFPSRSLLECFPVRVLSVSRTIHPPRSPFASASSHIVPEKSTGGGGGALFYYSPSPNGYRFPKKGEGTMPQHTPGFMILALMPATLLDMPVVARCSRRGEAVGCWGPYWIGW